MRRWGRQNGYDGVEFDCGERHLMPADFTRDRHSQPHATRKRSTSGVSQSARRSMPRALLMEALAAVEAVEAVDEEAT